MNARRPPRNVRSADVRARAAAGRDAIGRAGGEGADDAVAGEGRALRRGLQVLEAVRAAGDDGVRIVELCRSSGLARAPVHRLLQTLVELGYVARLGRFRYVGGPQADPVRAVRRGPAPSDLAPRLQPVLAQVSAACADPSFAVVREGHSSWCIARQVGTHPVQVLSVQVGYRQPLGVGAAGLALLAALPADEAEAAIESHGMLLERYGGMTPERMRILVRASQARGWSLVGNHAVPGALGVGLPVRESDGTLIAAISVAAPMGRMTGAHQRVILRAMRGALKSHGFRSDDG